jgi:serine/threonine protein kinase
MSFIPGANVGPYRIVEQAERSGVATTYTAYQPSLGRYVSLVVAPAIDRDDVELLRQYRRQLELVLTLRHPNLLTVIDHGEHLDVPFVVTETVEAEPLAERLGAPWPPNEVVRVLRPIAAALDYAHGLGVVHGDVRSPSVLLTPDGTPILSGFGLLTRPLAVPAGSSLGEAARHASFMSEEVERAQPADRRGLALIAYEMLTGRTIDVDAADFERPLSPAQIGSPLLATPVERVLLRELTGEAGDRYPSATAFVDDLATPIGSSRPNGVTPASLAPLSPTVRMPPAASSTSSPESRRPLITVALIVAALALLGALATLLRGGEASRPFAPSARAPGSEGSAPGASLSTNVAATSFSGVPASEAAGSETSAPGASAAGTDSQPSGTSGTTPEPVAQPTAPSAAAASGQAAGPAAGAGSASASGTPARSGPSISVLVSTPGATDGAVQPGATSADIAALPGATPTAISTPRPATPIPPAAGSTRLPVTWRVVGDPSGRWMLDDQSRVAGRTETGASVVLFPESVDDIAFSAMVNTTTCQATLVFRAQDDDNLLMAIYIPDGLPAPGTAGGGVWLYQRVEGLDLPIRAVRPSTVRPAGEPARLKIVTSGPNISVFLNDEPGLQAIDTAPRSGRLGLMVYSTSGRLCEATFGEIER